VPAVTEAVIHGKTGVLVDPCDAEAAGAALVRLLSEPLYAQRLADAGRTRANDLAWPAVVARYRRVIDHVRSSSPRGRPSHSVRWAFDLALAPQSHPEKVVL
jgi:glycosyltransferase involved in cell wall biosynthesis